MNQIDRKSHRNKDTLSPLNEVLLRLKPSTFKDNYLASFKVRYHRGHHIHPISVTWRFYTPVLRRSIFCYGAVRLSVRYHLSFLSITWSFFAHKVAKLHTRTVQASAAFEVAFGIRMSRRTRRFDRKTPKMTELYFRSRTWWQIPNQEPRFPIRV